MMGRVCQVLIFLIFCRYDWFLESDKQSKARSAVGRTLGTEAFDR